MNMGTGVAVLVIDDEKGLRDMLCYTLGRLGYRVRAAADGEAGLAAARAEDFDVVVCDVMMPEMDGITVLEALKKDHPALEVIMATGFPNVETSARATELGAFAYVAKPYELTALCALLQAAAAKRRS